MNSKKNNLDVRHLPFTPIIIIGAPRSGTNALRDALTNISGFDSWPCDEINGIWKHGNLKYKYDDLKLENANEKVISFIRNCFYKRWLATGKPNFLVEKTTANSLRVEFVKKVFPEAKFIFLIRDGKSVIKSAAKRWKGEFEYNLTEYWLKKFPYIPFQDFPYYFINTISNRMKILLSNESTQGMSSWGPRHPSFSDLNDLSLEEKCILQWSLCLIQSNDAFNHSIEKKEHVVITYDLLTQKPKGVLKLLSFFLEDSLLSNSIEEFSKDLIYSEKKARHTLEISLRVKDIAEEALRVYDELNKSSNKTIQDLVF